MGIALGCVAIGCIIMLLLRHSIYDHPFMFGIGVVLAVVGLSMIGAILFDPPDDEAIMQEYVSAIALNEHFLIVDDDTINLKALNSIREFNQKVEASKNSRHSFWLLGLEVEKKYSEYEPIEMLIKVADY